MKTIEYAHIISHTHWDREWYLNSKYTNEWLVPFFQALFAMLEKESRYRFVLDGQTSIIEDCREQLERRGADVGLFEEKLRRYASAGRLLIGPYYLQPDWQLVSDEALVRNLLIGEQTAREYGPVMRVGWLLDNFGQISQAPQIHHEFGIAGLYVWRGVEMDPAGIRSEFRWQSPDGTAVTAVYLVGSYRNGMRLAAYPESTQLRVQVEVEKLASFASTPNILIMNGYDQEMYPDDILPMIERGALDMDGIRVIQSTPGEYLDAIRQHDPALPVLKGALYSGRYISVFPGILSSRMYLKTENDFCQRQLEKYAEPLATVAWSLGAPYPAEALARSWKLLLKNHPHDSICGVSIDDVHTDMEERFKECEVLSKELVQRSVSTWVAQIDTTRHDGELPRWVIVNTSMQERSGVVTLEGVLPRGGLFQDGEGRVVRSQEIGSDKHLVFLPRIPGLGYQVLYTAPSEPIPDSESAAPSITCDVGESTLENAFVHVRVHGDGSLTLTDKLNQAIYPRVAIFEDRADAGDEYNYSPPRQDQVITTSNCQAKIEFVERGPLRVRVKIVQTIALPEELSADRQSRSAKMRALPIVTWLTLEAGSPILKFHTRVRNTVKDHRLRVFFPTGIRTSNSHAGAQFDVVDHAISTARYDDSSIPANVREILLGAREPEPVTIFPQRMFVDLNDGTKGIAVLNRGLPEYEILKTSNTIALTLFRSVGWIARPDLAARIGDAGPLIATPDAQCLRTLDFHYALFTHPGDWQQGSVPRRADEFNSEVLAIRTDRHSGLLPDSWQSLSLYDPSESLRVTAIKRSEDGQAVIVRLYNPTPETVEGELRAFFEVKSASYVTLDEIEKEKIKVYEGNHIPLKIPAKKIVTVRLEIERWSLPPVDTPTLAISNAGDDEIDLDAFEPVEPISEADIRAEEERAVDLGQLLAGKEQLLLEQLTKDGEPKDWAALLHLSQMRLDVETFKRAFWEARLSATLLRKKYVENRSGGHLSQTDSASFESTLREIGLILNQTRVSKRAGEYIVDCYRRLL